MIATDNSIPSNVDTSRPSSICRCSFQSVWSLDHTSSCLNEPQVQINFRVNWWFSVVHLEFICFFLHENRFSKFTSDKNSIFVLVSTEVVFCWKISLLLHYNPQGIYAVLKNTEYDRSTLIMLRSIQQTKIPMQQSNQLKSHPWLISPSLVIVCSSLVWIYYCFLSMKISFYTISSLIFRMEGTSKFSWWVYNILPKLSPGDLSSINYFFLSSWSGVSIFIQVSMLLSFQFFKCC
jgi:hypothetical protein